MPIPPERTMRAVVVPRPGGPDVMAIATAGVPQPGPDDLLVRVRAAALNHADLLQRAGEFLAPPGESDILGVEIAGDVVAAGARAQVPAGSAVFGLVGGGGYADYCRIDSAMAIPIPAGLSYAEAASLPEACFTADTALFRLGMLRKRESVLIHGGGSGIGTACIQMAKSVGARVACTVGSVAKVEHVRSLGADLVVHHREQDFVAAVRKWMDGVDVVIDIVGADYFDRNLDALRAGGRLVQLGVMSGTRCSLDLDKVIFKRLQIKGAIMRPLPIAEKRRISRRFCERWLPRVADGTVRPVIDSLLSLAEASRAHQRLEASAHVGKIVLDVSAAAQVPAPRQHTSSRCAGSTAA